MFSFRKPSALIVSGLLLLQTFGIASAATSPPAPKAQAGPVRFTPSQKLTAELNKARAERLTMDALKGYREAKLPGRGGGASDTSAHKAAPLYKDNDSVRVIVTLEGQSVAEQVAARGTKIQTAGADWVRSAAQSTAAARGSVITAARSAGVSLNVRHTYDVALNGFSGQMRYGDVAKLQRLPGVKQVSVAKRYYPLDNFSTSLVGASDLWNRNPAVDGIGQVIAIIDTGVDYRHPELGAQSGLDPNGKVVGGWNFADDNGQVLDFGGSGHGTHVAGIAAGTGQGPQHMMGMAPKAKILAQKVFSNDVNNGSAWTDDLVKAIDDSLDVFSPHHPGIVADVMNMSLGADSGFADPADPEQVAIAAAVSAGAVMAIAAGNAAQVTGRGYPPYYWNQDLATVGSPGTSPEAITVASSQNTKVTVEGRGLAAKIDGAAYVGGHTTVYLDGSGPYGAFATLGAASFPLAVPSGDERGCTTSDWAGADLTGKIALVKRGTPPGMDPCSFLLKTDNAAAAGAKGVVVFNANPDPDIFTMTAKTATIPAVMVMNSFGTDLQTAVKAGKQVKVAFNGPVQNLLLNDPHGDTMSDFSSWGTTPELGFKPDLTAPGGNIFSSTPNGQYEVWGGTSMATPHVAGAAALIKQAHPNFTPADVKAALMNTAKLLTPDGENPYSPRQQGAGRIQVDKAIDTKVVVTTGNNQSPSLVLGEVASHSVTPFTLTVKNSGPSAASFDLSGAVYRPSKYLDSRVSLFPLNGLHSTVLEGAAVTFEGPSNITVPAGQSLTVTGSLDLSSASDPPEAQYGYFAEGFITLTSKTAGTLTSTTALQPDLSVPYISFVGDWNAQPIIDPMYDDDMSYFGFTGISTPNPAYDKKDTKSPEYLPLGYSFDGTFDSNAMAINNGGVVSATTTAIGTPPHVGAAPALTLLRNAQSVQIDVIDSAGKVVDRIGAEQALRNLAITDHGYYLGAWLWDGRTYNRSTGDRVPVAEGQYRVRVRSLLTGRNADKPGDWQTYLMPVKVDNIGPEFTGTPFLPPTVPGRMTMAWSEASDSNSGLYGFVPTLGDKVLADHWVGPAATGSVSFDIPAGTYDGLSLCAVDNASNWSCQGYFTQFTTNAIAAVDTLDVLTNKAAVSLPYTIDPSVKQVTYQVGVDAEVKAGTSGHIDLNFAKDGKYTVIVRAYSDVAATAMVGSLTYKVDLDMTPPVVDLTSPDVRKSYGTGTITVEGSVTEAHPAAVDGVLYSLDDGDTAPVTLDAAGKFSFPVTFTGEGRHNLKFQTTDALDNHGEMARVVYIGTAGPTITTALDPASGPAPDQINVTVTNEGAFRLTGSTADPVNNYSFTIDGMAQYSTDVLDPSVARNWSYDVTGVGGAAPTVVTLQVSDLAGNKTTRKVIFSAAADGLVSATVTAPVTKELKVTVTGTVVPTVDSVWVNGIAATIDTMAAYSAVDVPLTEGKNVIQVLAHTTDPAVWGLAHTLVIRDTVAPVITMSRPVNGDFINPENGKPVTFTVTDANLDPETVTVNGKLATYLGAGKFTYPFTADPEGETAMTVVATDKAGNSSKMVTTFTVDATPPVVMLSLPPGVLSSGAVHVTGTATDALLDSVTVNGRAVTPDADGKFSIDLNFMDGVNEITVVAKDKAGNATPKSGTVTVDTKKPVISMISPTAGAYLKSTTVTVSGTVEELNLSTVKVDGVVVPVMGGSFSVNVTKLDGSRSVTVEAIDVVGHSDKKSVDFTVDATKPTITLSNLAEGRLVPKTITVSGTVVDANLVQVKVNGTTATVVGSTFTAQVTFVADAEDTVTVTATDKADNTEQTIVGVVVDGTAPTLTITSPTEGPIYTNPVTVSGTVSDKHTVGVTVNGTGVAIAGDGSFTTAIHLTDGKVKVVATDAVGNKTEKTVTAVVSTVLKSLSLSPSPKWSPKAGDLAINYELAAAGRVTLAVYDLDGRIKSTLIGDLTKPKGAATFKWNGKINGRVTDGTYEIRLTHGNASLSERITIETVAPPKPTIKTDCVCEGGYTRYRNPSFTGTAHGAATVTITVTGPSKVDAQTVSVAGDETYYADFTLSGRDGAYTFTAVARDALGNPSAPDTVKLSLDTVNPKKPTVTPQGIVTGATIKLTVGTSEPGYLLLLPVGLSGDALAQAMSNAKPLVSASGPAELGCLIPITGTSATITLALPPGMDGVWDFAALLMDRAGNISSTGPGDLSIFKITIDRDAPTLVISPTPTAAAGSTYVLTGTATDDGSGIASVMVNGQTVKVAKNGTFTYSYRLPAAAGKVTTFKVVVKDKTGKSVTQTFTVTTY